MDKVFVVEGVTGEYDDRSEWPVRAFGKQEDADGLCAKLNAWCEDHECDEDAPKASDFYYSYSHDCRPPEDPSFRCMHTGVKYRVYSIPFG